MPCHNVLLQEKRLRVSTEILSALKRWGRTATATAGSDNGDDEGVIGDGVSLEDIELARQGVLMQYYYCTHCFSHTVNMF
jgi:hypothetical protein